MIKSKYMLWKFIVILAICVCNFFSPSSSYHFIVCEDAFVKWANNKPLVISFNMSINNEDKLSRFFFIRSSVVSQFFLSDNMISSLNFAEKKRILVSFQFRFIFEWRIWTWNICRNRMKTSVFPANEFRSTKKKRTQKVDLVQWTTKNNGNFIQLIFQV